MVERAKIEAQLLELERMRVRLGFSRNSEGEKNKKRIDVAPEQPRPIEAKLRALDKFKTWAEGDVRGIHTHFGRTLLRLFAFSPGFRRRGSVPFGFSPGRVTSSPSTSSMSLEPSESTIKAVLDMKASDEEDADGTAKYSARQVSQVSSPALVREHAGT
ncbi:hypothetical protein EDB83DRAFT_2671673 [Lactarius deliciosus]|nr:hypothetical protein EDB83DRAFT_2671673 [Lactarius deliciosus]